MCMFINFVMSNILTVRLYIYTSENSNSLSYYVLVKLELECNFTVKSTPNAYALIYDAYKIFSISKLSTTQDTRYKYFLYEIPLLILNLSLLESIEWMIYRKCIGV